MALNAFFDYNGTPKRTLALYMAKYIRDIIITIIVALVIFFVLQATVGSYKVYGPSMLPGIKNGYYIMVNKVEYYFQSPERGDIIVFHSPNIAGTDLIKRIIGLPGDTVEVKNGKVYINNTPLAEPYVAESPNYKYSPEQVPPDQYFVLGDNRNNSTDSHTGWFLPRKNIVGKAWITYWPPPSWMLIKHYPLLAYK
jgi:signal peptidase I